MTFEEACFALQKGQINFDEFSAATRKTWENMGAYLLGKWRAPSWFSTEDVFQELLIGAWKAVWKFDPKRGTSFRRYIIFNAVDYAKKKLHKARGASLSGNADSNLGHLEKVFSELGLEEEGETPRAVERLLSAPPTQERHVERAGKALAACRTDREVAVVQILSCAGSLEEGVAIIMEVGATRKRCGVRTWQQACSVVEQVAVTVADRISAA